MVAQYYADRASTPGSLVITEATAISQSEEGQANLPGISTAEEAESWKKVFEAVHANGSFIFQQIWATGRASDPEYLATRGYKYVSSSATQLRGKTSAPEAMTEAEIWQKIGEFAEAAKTVIAAGADGVELHGAHGYLIEQFTKDSINKRTDKWGGSVENRARFLLEIVKATVAAIGAERVGLRLSPYATFQDSISSDAIAQYQYIIRELKNAGYKFAYLHLVEARGDPAKLDIDDDTKTLEFIVNEWDNQSPVIVAGGYTPETAARAVDGRYAKWNVLVAFGRHYISNPDLVFRIKHGLKLSPYDRTSFYLKKDPRGYNDYPFSQEYLEARAAVAA